MDAREVAEHDDGGLDLSVPSAERGRDDRDGHPTAVAALDEALGLGAALARGERLAEPPHDGSVGREDLLDVASSARRAERSVRTSAAEFQKTIRSSASTAMTASGRPASTAS